jgi:spore germination protein GerM
MAQRKTTPRRTAKKPPAKTRRVPVSMAFWVLFFIVLISIFFILLPMVKKGITLPQRQTVTEQPAVEEPLAQEQKPPPQEPRAQPKPPAEKPPAKPETKPPEQRQPPAAQEKPPTKPLEQRQPPEQPRTQQPARQPTPQPESKPLEQRPPPEQRQPPETRDRTVYFMREGGGDLTLAKTTRKLAVSDSPLIDCVNALLAGPSAEEKNRGLASYIPPNTRLLSARVVGNTVHLNFNEAFRYNTFGREGCEAQLRQVVWTATEFPNVNNVQIEIEGKIVDFLIEGIIIRNPIGR